MPEKYIPCTGSLNMMKTVINGQVNDDKQAYSRQFCSKFVFDILHEALSVRVGKIETFRELLQKNPDASLTFWKCWFLGSIPWSRRTITPGSLWRNPDLALIYHSHVQNSDVSPPVTC